MLDSAKECNIVRGFAVAMSQARQWAQTSGLPFNLAPGAAHAKLNRSRQFNIRGEKFLLCFCFFFSQVSQVHKLPDTPAELLTGRRGRKPNFRLRRPILAGRSRGLP